MFVLGLLIFCLKVKFLLDYTNSISPNKYEKDDKTILKHFQQQKVLLWIDFKEARMKKISCTKCKKYKEFKKPKILYICNKTLLLSSICNKCGKEDEKIFKEEESIEIWKILGLINNIEKYQMKKGNINQEFRLKNIEERKKIFIRTKWIDE